MPHGRRGRRSNRFGRHKIGRRRLVALLVAAVVAVVVVGIGFVALFTSVWSPRSVRVVGLHRLTRAEVLSTAELNRNEPLLRLSKASVAARIEQLPDVRTARISTSLPDTVTITVAERVPAAYRRVDATHWQYIDDTGHYFGSLTKPPAHLAELVPAPSVATDVPTLSALATVAQALPVSMRRTVRRITAANADDVELVLRDKRVVMWGSADRSADKAAVLPALLKRRGEQFDVTNPDLVVAR